MVFEKKCVCVVTFIVNALSPKYIFEKKIIYNTNSQESIKIESVYISQKKFLYTFYCV